MSSSAASVSLNDSTIIKELVSAKEWNKSRHKVSDDIHSVIDVTRPFIKIYKEFKLLNAFAIINEVAM